MLIYVFRVCGEMFKPKSGLTVINNQSSSSLQKSVLYT